MVPIDIELCFETAVQLVKTAGKHVKGEFQKCQAERVEGMQTQYRIDFSTKADKSSEDILIQGLTSAFPSHVIMAEEQQSSKKTQPQPDLTGEPTWIIDPLDGTLNYVHGYPQISISVAFFVEKNPVIGIILNILTEELYTAKVGQGAFLNGKRIYASGQKELSKSMVVIDLVTFPQLLPIRHGIMLRNFHKLFGKVHGTRIVGSAALSMALVAMGAADAYFEYGIKAWDMAAGQILIQESGGCIIDPEGGPFNVMDRRLIAAGSPELAKELSETLEHYGSVPEIPNI